MHLAQSILFFAFLILTSAACVSGKSTDELEKQAKKFAELLHEQMSLKEGDGKSVVVKDDPDYGHVYDGKETEAKLMDVIEEAQRAMKRRIGDLLNDYQQLEQAVAKDAPKALELLRGTTGFRLREIEEKAFPMAGMQAQPPQNPFGSQRRQGQFNPQRGGRRNQRRGGRGKGGKHHSYAHCRRKYRDDRRARHACYGRVKRSRG